MASFRRNGRNHQGVGFTEEEGTRKSAAASRSVSKLIYRAALIIIRICDASFISNQDTPSVGVGRWHNMSLSYKRLDSACYSERTPGSCERLGCSSIGEGVSKRRKRPYASYVGYHARKRECKYETRKGYVTRK